MKQNCNNCINFRGENATWEDEIKCSIAKCNITVVKCKNHAFSTDVYPLYCEYVQDDNDNIDFIRFVYKGKLYAEIDVLKTPDYLDRTIDIINEYLEEKDSAKCIILNKPEIFFKQLIESNPKELSLHIIYVLHMGTMLLERGVRIEQISVSEISDNIKTLDSLVGFVRNYDYDSKLPFITYDRKNSK